MLRARLATVLGLCLLAAGLVTAFEVSGEWVLYTLVGFGVTGLTLVAWGAGRRKHHARRRH